MGRAKLAVTWDTLWRIVAIAALALATASIAWAWNANANLAVSGERDKAHERRLGRIENKLDKLLLHHKIGGD